VNAHSQDRRACLKRANRRHRACISYGEESATEKAISKCPDNAEALKISIFLLPIRRLRQTGCSPSFEDSCVLNGRESSSLLESVGADEDDRLGRGRLAIEKRRACLLCCMLLLHLVTAVAAFLNTIIKRWHHKQMAHVLWQQRCLEVASRLHHVGVVDETRRTYRHHGRPTRRASAHRNVPPRDAARRNTSLRNA
jgi:hypothetical protein